MLQKSMDHCHSACKIHSSDRERKKYYQINRSKDMDFNPKAKRHLPVHVLLFSLKVLKKKEKIRISKFLAMTEYVPAPQSLQWFHTLLKSFLYISFHTTDQTASISWYTAFNWMINRWKRNTMRISETKIRKLYYLPTSEKNGKFKSHV